MTCTTPWNYALDVSEQTVSKDVLFAEKPVGEVPFSPEGAPVVAQVDGVRSPGWKIVNGSAGETPKSPVGLEGPAEKLTLIPYGRTKLRITEFRTLKQ